MSERFSNRAGGGDGSVVFIRPSDLARAGFTGVVAEGEFIEALPSRYEEGKHDFKVIADTELIVRGENNKEEKYEKIIKPGDTLVVNQGGNLGYLMSEVGPGTLCQIKYNGMNTIEKGTRKGTKAHAFEVLYE